MSEIIIKNYQCDRCSVISDEPFSDCTEYHPVYNINIKEYYAGFPGRTIKWGMLCDDCNDLIYKVLKDLIVD